MLNMSGSLTCRNVKALLPVVVTGHVTINKMRSHLHNKAKIKAMIYKRFSYQYVLVFIAPLNQQFE
jgi:hypothetical protein